MLRKGSEVSGGWGATDRGRDTRRQRTHGVVLGPQGSKPGASAEP